MPTPVDLFAFDQAVNKGRQQPGVAAVVSAHVDDQLVHVVGVDKLEEKVRECGERLLVIITHALELEVWPHGSRLNESRLNGTEVD